MLATYILRYMHILQATGKHLDANQMVMDWYRSGFEKELYLMCRKM